MSEFFDVSVLMNTLKVKSFIDNIVTGTFDVKVTVHRQYQVTKEETIMHSLLKFNNERSSRINVPFTAPLTDDTVIRVKVNQSTEYNQHEIGLSMVGGHPTLVRHYEQEIEFEHPGYRFYNYSDKENNHNTEWPAIDSYSIDSLTTHYFVPQTSSYIGDNRRSYSFYTSREVKNLEQFADIICNTALKMNAFYIIMYYTDQDNKDYPIRVYRDEISDFDTHELLESIRLGYQHWRHLAYNRSSLEVTKMKQVLDLTRFRVISPQSDPVYDDNEYDNNFNDDDDDIYDNDFNNDDDTYDYDYDLTIDLGGGNTYTHTYTYTYQLSTMTIQSVTLKQPHD
ncbi:hypothetical protein PPL_00810 [Heterostelium album PN500]|uniref:Uncharacterized protein n=1 Tax=Heterostelium pallidum (strain ATCC 26659 / Pp 5 / PN500) TaxID=670386 RepID=D3AXH9_HETP5|nr:hypothetical protein PPL_00810 [Heterostelium album PN500]EFA86248.1 hypothetical protein PPL_00810 [Heterostelium album PN500]|eukprot:XP_020438353.1 hypothetical protein PPL_00810 [Heterostelium album PN500]